ncbi:hypothetical protein WJX74_008596 [Apatococcus lobatus]|uniref:Uncharacterized protein n=1 Tax=Apatococcus lobatus TaxID=904363 RepID=A0AAW1QIF4_9CHLO
MLPVAQGFHLAYRSEGLLNTGVQTQTAASFQQALRASRQIQSAARSNLAATRSVAVDVGKSGLTCGTITFVGDVLAQAITRGQDTFADFAATDASRAIRMGAYGFFIYGPIMWRWYPLLESIWPTHSLRHTLSKIAANQLCLGPTILLTSFTWNYALQNQLNQLPEKLKKDGIPTMLNGWSFWVPAAALNFTVVPLRYRLPFMSVCGVCWTGYLSAKANTADEEEAQAAANAV